MVWMSGASGPLKLLAPSINRSISSTIADCPPSLELADEAPTVEDAPRVELLLERLHHLKALLALTENVDRLLQTGWGSQQTTVVAGVAQSVPEGEESL